METLHSDIGNVERCLQSLQQTDVSKYKGFIRRATPMDANIVSKNLRAEDAEEIRANTGMHHQSALYMHALQGRTLVSGLQKDMTPEILWGLDPVSGQSDTAIIWMVSTPRIYEHPQLFVPVTKVLWDKAHETFPFLVNFIDCRNTRHVEWVKWLGARMISRLDDFEANGESFYEFISFKE